METFSLGLNPALKFPFGLLPGGPVLLASTLLFCPFPSSNLAASNFFFLNLMECV